MKRIIILLISLSCMSLNAQSLTRDSITKEVMNFYLFLNSTLPAGYDEFVSDDNVIVVFIEDSIVGEKNGFRLFSIPQSFIGNFEEYFFSERYCFSWKNGGNLHLFFQRSKGMDLIIPCSGENLAVTLKELSKYISKEDSIKRGEILQPIFDPLILGGLFEKDSILVFPSLEGSPF